VTAYFSNLAVEARRRAIQAYLKRRQLYPFQVPPEPSANLGLVVVIPCCDEPDLAETLVSLGKCDPPGCDVEILVVINAPADAPRQLRMTNDRAMEQLESLCADLPHWLQCHGLRHDELPVRYAGVGLARKIGMDEAASRVSSNSDCDGVIVSVDADCKVAADFLIKIRHLFADHHDCPGVSIYFEHPIPARERMPIDEAIIDYELHLRYYVRGQRIARFPYAFHTVGSAMACRAAVYAEQGGMNRRQGGEDFYFIQKLIALGGYRTLTTTTVYPGVRLSTRVPFGTGPAIASAMNNTGGQETFAPEIFSDLAEFCAASADQPEKLETMVRAFPEALRQFLDSQSFETRLIEIQRNVSSPQAFRKRLYRWFNAFRFLKFAQFASETFYPRVPVARAAQNLLESANCSRSSEQRDAYYLLQEYRHLDRTAVTNEIIEDLL
jgi:hypothetical protein